MSQSNAKIRSFPKLLITCSFLSFLVGEAKAVNFTDVFEDDRDVQTALRGSIKDVLKEKTEKKKNSYKTSDKVTLSPVCFEHFYDDVACSCLEEFRGQFREFLMPDDSNGALNSIGITYAQAKELLLLNAHDSYVRDIVRWRIVREFDNLPPEMQAKQSYITLKNALRNIKEELDFYLLQKKSEENNNKITALMSQGDDVKIDIQNYANSPETYTDYINYAFVDGRHMRYSRDITSYYKSPCLIDVIAYLFNKRLAIWGQYDNYDIITQYTAGAPFSLLHYYEPFGFKIRGVLHIIDRGNHFNRLVFTHDRAGLANSALEEEKAIAVNAFADLSYGLLKNNRSIEYHLNKMIVDDCQFSYEDIKKAHAKIEVLKKKEFLEKERISQKELKAYCMSFIAGLKLAKEELQKDVDIDIEQVKSRINKTHALRDTNKSVREKFIEAMQKAETLALKKAAAVAEIQKIDHQISVFEKVSNLIREVISENDIFAALSATIFTLGQENEVLMETIEKKKAARSNEEAAQLEKEVEYNSFRNNIFGRLFSLFQKHYRENVQKRLQFNLNKSKIRVKTWLDKKQTLNLDIEDWDSDSDDSIELVDDFEDAKAVLEYVAEVTRQQDVPYLNPEFIMFDPYLHTHNRDIHAEYPEQITNEAWEAFSQQVSEKVRQYLIMGGIDEATKNDTQESLIHFSEVLTKAAIKEDDPAEARKHTLRKRINRILDTLLSQAEEGDAQAALSAYATFARLMAQNYTRCIDGVELGVDKIEQDLIFSSGEREVFVEKTVSKILTNDKHDFIRQHSYFGEGAEEKTEVPAFLLQRMRYPLSLRGEPTDIAYPGYARVNDYELAPWKVMKRYLEGESFYSDEGILLFKFEARTPEKLVSLLYDAYEKGIDKSKDQERMFSNQELSDFALHDTRLSALYKAFVESFQDGTVIESQHFEIRNDNIGYKRAFFEYILKRLGYIIDPLDSSINILSDKSQGVLKNLALANYFESAASSSSAPIASSSSADSSMHPVKTFRTTGTNPNARNKHSAISIQLPNQQLQDDMYTLVINHRTSAKGAQVRTYAPKDGKLNILGDLPLSATFSDMSFNLTPWIQNIREEGALATSIAAYLTFAGGQSDIHSFTIQPKGSSLMTVILGDKDSEAQSGIHVYAPETDGDTNDWSESRSDE